MENQLIVLPQEVEKLAANVSIEKRNEVQNVLNHVFNGVSKMREQLDTVNVTDENDKVNMKLANTIRLGVRNVRLEAEKTFDAKRAEVQQAMLSFKTEDALWLKAKQTMQILTKEIETAAKWKEETRERFESERKELKIQERINKVAVFNPEISRMEFESMSDETFDIFLASIEARHNEKIEAERKAEQERIEKEKAEAEERARIRIENERLKAEAEAKEKALAIERAKIEAERKQEREENERKLKAEQDAARIQAEKDAKERAILEAKLKAEAEAKKASEQKAIAEQKAKEAEAKKAANAPDKEKLKALAKQIESLQMPLLSTEESKAILSDVRGLLSKVVNYLNEKSSKL